MSFRFDLFLNSFSPQYVDQKIQRFNFAAESASTEAYKTTLSRKNDLFWMSLTISARRY